MNGREGENELNKIIADWVEERMNERK